MGKNSNKMNRGYLFRRNQIRKEFILNKYSYELDIPHPRFDGKYVNDTLTDAEEFIILGMERSE